MSWALKKAKDHWNDRTLPLLGVIAAFIFAAQLVNFPIGAGTSGHLFGGLLAALFVGPAGAAIVLTTVLAVQALVFQDGGITTLGANLLNMAVIGTVAGFLAYRAILSILGENRRPLAAAAGSWISVMTAALACSLELGLAKAAPFKLILGSMLFVHAIIGCLEAIITATVVASMAQLRPDLFYAAPTIQTSAAKPPTPRLIPVLTAVFGLMLLLAPLSSSAPDGLESVAQKLNFSQPAERSASTPLLNPGPAARPGQWVSGAIAATAGTGATGLIVLVIACWLQRGVRTK